MFLRNGAPFNIDAAFECDGVQFLAGTVRRAAPEERAAWGITEVPDPEIPDGRLFTITQNPDGSYAGTPKPQDQIVASIYKPKIAQAWAECASRLENGQSTVTTSAGTYSYGTDTVTQDNIMKALSGVLALITPNPRPWTPKGQLAPISVTHDDIKFIAAALGAVYDAHVQAYLVHKATILSEADPLVVLAYDVTTGWPSLA